MTLRELLSKEDVNLDDEIVIQINCVDDNNELYLLCIEPTLIDVGDEQVYLHTPLLQTEKEIDLFDKV